MSVSCTRFIEGIAKTGILAAAELDTLKQSIGAEKQAADADPLARELVQQGKLTKYQAAALCQDKAATLVLGNYVVLAQAMPSPGMLTSTRCSRM